MTTGPPPHPADRPRHLLGALMEAAGFGPAGTPFRVVAEEPGFRLRGYGGRMDGPALVIVASPIKRPYIWDLAPEASVLRGCLEAGLRVHLVEWVAPDGGAADHGLGDYADRFLARALDAVAADGGGRGVVLAGHSLGGTLAALFASLHPERVRGLVLLEAPLAFADRAGAFTPLVAAAGSSLRPVGPVPGAFLTAASVAAAPDAFVGAVWRDRLASLPDPAARRLHGRVMRWAYDEVPMSPRLFADIMEDLYREDRFARGNLRIAGRRADPARLAMPVLAVVDPGSTVVPPESALSPLPAGNRRVLTYAGDRGTALRHVGVLVGPSAHRALWPAIHRWLASLPVGALTAEERGC